jgi:hypothetical protein
MNSTAEQIARKQCAELYDPEHVTVRVNTAWNLGFCLPVVEGKEEWAIFNTLSFADNYAIDKATSYEVELGEKSFGGGKIMARVTDLNEFKRLLVKRNLVSWSLDIPIERDSSGWMTPECYTKVSNISAPLLDAFVRKFEESIEVSEEEEQVISRQSSLLFSKNGRGVTDACEAVSRFCTLGSFSEKFGVNREDLPKMPYKEFLLLKIMIAKESDALRVQQHSASKGSGGGGRGHGKEVRIPMPGSGGI